MLSRIFFLLLIVSDIENVYIDAFSTSEVDIADLNNLDNNALQAGQTAHILSERMNVSEEGGYDNEKNRTEEIGMKYHLGIAMVDEAKATGEALGIPMNNAARRTPSTPFGMLGGNPIYATTTYYYNQDASNPSTFTNPVAISTVTRNEGTTPTGAKAAGGKVLDAKFIK